MLQSGLKQSSPASTKYRRMRLKDAYNNGYPPARVTPPREIQIALYFRPLEPQSSSSGSKDTTDTELARDLECLAGGDRPVFDTILEMFSHCAHIGTLTRSASAASKPLAQLLSLLERFNLLVQGLSPFLDVLRLRRQVFEDFVVHLGNFLAGEDIGDAAH